MNRLFKTATTRAGLPPIKVHALRHTFTTLLLAPGTPVRVVSDVLGHADPSTTHRAYSHAMPSVARDAVAALSASLLG